MTLRSVNPAQARLLLLAVEVDIPRRIAEWDEHLRSGRLTDEMRGVFEALGYLERETRRQRRPRLDSHLDHLFDNGPRDSGLAAGPWTSDRVEEVARRAWCGKPLDSDDDRR